MTSIAGPFPLPGNKPSELPVASSVGTSDTLIVTQSGVTKTATVAQVIANAGSGNGSTTSAPMAGLAVDVTQNMNTKTISTDVTLTFSATPATDAIFGLWLKNSDASNPHVITIPSSFSVGKEATITSFVIAKAGELFLNWRYDGTVYKLLGDSPFFNNNGATTAPGVTDDATKGYGAGTFWVDGTGNNVYICKSPAVGAAIWIQVNVAGGGSVSDGDKGDITVLGGVWTIDPKTVTLAKMADMATGSLLGRTTAAAGSPEVLAPTAARALLGLGTAALAQATDFTPATVVEEVASTSYTLSAADNGKIKSFTSASATIVTVPSGLSTSFGCTLRRDGAGTLTISPSGTTLNSINGQTAVATRYGAAVITPTLTANVFNLGWFSEGPTSGGSGTVTHTVGALTANALMVGAGAADSKVAAGITTDGNAAMTFGIAGTTVGSAAFANATSGTVTLQPATGALGTSVLTLPAVTGTLLTTAAAVSVAQGGTGVATLTAYAPIFGGTTGTGALQSGSVGTAGQVLTSNGAGAIPTFQSITGTGTVTHTAGALANNALVLGAGSGDTKTNAAIVSDGVAGLALGTAGSLSGSVTFYNGTSGSIALLAQAGALGATTLSLPAGTGTLLSTANVVTVAQGGTGIAAGTSGGIPYYSGTTTIASSAALTSNSLVLGGGAGAAPKVVAGVTSAGVSAINLGVAGTSVGKTVFANATSGSVTLQAATGALGTSTATLPAGTYTVATQTEARQETIVLCASDETTAITTGTGKASFIMPFAMTVTSVMAGLNTVSSSGLPTFDIKQAGTSILSTLLTIDATEASSLTAATPAVVSNASLTQGSLITVDITVAGTGAKGAKVYITGTR